MCSPSIWPLVADERNTDDASCDAGSHVPCDPPRGDGGPFGPSAISEIREVVPRLCDLAGWNQGQAYPIEVLVPGGSNHRSSGLCVRHVCQSPAPHRSFVRLDAGVFVSSPEFTFLQMASQLDEIELAQLGYSLCGEYFPCDNDRGFVKRPRLTTTGQLNEYLSQLDGVRNIAKARRALRWVCDGSRSPMETSTALLLSTSRRTGGYGLPKPHLNQRIVLSHESAMVANTPYYLADLLYPEQKVAIAYLGKAYHKNVERDLTREYVLRSEGYTLFDVTIAQIVSGTLRNQLVLSIADAIGYRLRKSTPTVREKRNTLLNQILPHPSRISPTGEVTWMRSPWSLPQELSASK